MEAAHQGAASRLHSLPTRLINQTALLADRATEQAMAGTGSRRYHYAVLTTLHEGGASSQAELGRRTGIDRSDIVAVLNDLVARGFVERATDPGDRRRNIVNLAEPGRDHLRELDRRLDLAQQDLLAALSAAERRTLVALLGRILDDHATRAAGK
ncbi:MULTISPECIES: MarR family winged helix-turn-helix transcriptional regulator [Nocardia]|uniref:MarR family winged helix-turn-helix transcriptional regulator n=1 Tax=Nocardia TaxID=1817 RepID=UPI001896279E|nr:MULTISPECIES: MarR family transcriptional regulator [Nocardia]MBF6351714.1 MarR family transcriptional regulator [Nocardia flavorosea]